MKKLLFLLPIMFLVGCVSNLHPYVAYEGEHPHSDTAIFIAQDPTSNVKSLSTFYSVDGKERPHLAKILSGERLWVRVLPGSHEFIISYQSGVVPGVRYKLAMLPVKLPDMKPRHVYIARYQELDEKVYVSVEDLGENPNYDLGSTLGLLYKGNIPKF